MLSVLIGYALDPVVTMITKLKINRAAAAALVLIGLVTGVIATAYSLRFQAAAVLEGLPEGARKLRGIMQASREGDGPIDKMKKAASEIEKTASVAAGASPAPRGVARVQI